MSPAGGGRGPGRRDPGGRRAGARATALAGLGALVLVVAMAGPAHAGTPELTVTSPGDGVTVLTSQPTIDGSASATSLGGIVTGNLQVTIASAAGRPGYRETVPNWCNQAACSFSLTVASGLAYNGRYSLSAQATETDPLIGTSQPAIWSGTFSVAVPPGPPSGLVAQPAADGSSIALTWQPNPEPDILGYEISRSPAGSGSWPETVTGTSLVDDQVVPGTGYTYDIVALRPGGTSGSTLTSTPSSVSAVAATPAPQAGRGSGGRAAGPAGGKRPAAVGGKGAGAVDHPSAAPAPAARTSAPAAAGRRPGPGPVPVPVPVPATLAPPADGVAPGSDNPAVAPFSPGPGGPTRAEAGGLITISYQTTTGNHDAVVRDVAALALAALLLAVAVHLVWLRRQLRPG